MKIGLTGSIGMGKSTTAEIFADEGVPVWSADDAVHRLYSDGADGALAINHLYPEAVVDGSVDRDVLSRWISEDPGRLKEIEHLIHPLVRRDREQFIEEAQSDILVFDIPLLFETDASDEFDFIVVVSAPADVQEARVLARPGMTAKKLQMILSLQTSDIEKRGRADFVVETTSLERATEQVQNVLREIRQTRQSKHARNCT